MTNIINKLEKEFNKFNVNIYDKNEEMTFGMIKEISQKLHISGFEIMNILKKLHNLD